MSGAGFILAINLFIAGLFAAAFTVIATQNRERRAARWFALGFGIGMFNAVFEFLMPSQTDPYWMGFGIFVCFLAALTFLAIGIAQRYGAPVPWPLLGIVFTISFVLGLFILDMPRESFLRMVLYQAPYTVMQGICAGIVWRHGRHEPISVAAFWLMALSAVHFLSKPFLAVVFGPGVRPQAYLTSDYALFSQTMSAVLIIATGLALLLLLVRDIIDDITAKSQTDMLSGLLNRRGFEERVEPALAAAHAGAVPASLIICDLDEFKLVNDTYGHASGDHVIRAFARLLREAAQGAPAARVGGEEFAVFLLGANLASARLCAETIRTAFASLPIEGLPEAVRATASFGVAQSEPDESLSHLLRRADIALYQAKKGGRDRVVAAGSVPTRPFPGPVPVRSSR